MVVSVVQNQRSESISEREEEGRKIKRHWVYRAHPYWGGFASPCGKGPSFGEFRRCGVGALL